MIQRVLHVTAELWPFAQTGGLGQAVAGLAAHQAASGLETSILLPLYREARQRALNLEPLGAPFSVDVGGVREQLQCWQLPHGPGARTLFLEHAPSFDRPRIYGDTDGDYPDNHRRFAVFAAGAVEVARQLGLEGLLLHAHDWHAALALVYLREGNGYQSRFDALPTVLTVHNGGFQGHFPPSVLGEIGLPERLWAADGMEWYGRLNYLKGGLRAADMVTTVSPTHADEMRTEVGGFGLHDVFLGLDDRLVGIRNGIDMDVWNPAIDIAITARFDVDDLSGKARCKQTLQRAWNVPRRAHIPLFAMSARLVSQKGLDLILGSTYLRDAQAQFLFLGAGEARYETALHALAREYPSHIALNTAFTDTLEHRLLAGADFLMMPCLYEPCGLTQMRAQRFGALPIARRVGGLADTIQDGRTGILFDAYTPDAFDDALRRALELYGQPERLRELVRQAMSQDFSWSRPAQDYAAVYDRACAARGLGGSPASPGREPEASGARARPHRDRELPSAAIKTGR